MSNSNDATASNTKISNNDDDKDLFTLRMLLMVMSILTIIAIMLITLIKETIILGMTMMKIIIPKTIMIRIMLTAISLNTKPK